MYDNFDSASAICDLRAIRETMPNTDPTLFESALAILEITKTMESTRKLLLFSANAMLQNSGIFGKDCNASYHWKG